MSNLPTVAAIVVAYNGGDALQVCVESLRAQTLDEVEIIVVDNASTDGSIAKLERAYRGRVHIIRRETNDGYAVGANVGWHAAKAELIAILNQDLMLMPSCLGLMRDALLSCGRDSLVTPKLVLKSDPSRVNAIGNEVHLSGVAWCNGEGTLADDWRGVLEVTAISGAAFMARASFLERMHGLEESYFMYMEDVDLSLRVQLAGGVCLAACDAVAVHDWTLTLGAGRFELLERNRRALWDRFWARNGRMYPLLVQAELMAWLYAIIHGRDHVRAKLRARRVGARPATNFQSSSSPLLDRLARRHPYELLFPGSSIIPRLGHAVDSAFSALVRTRKSRSATDRRTTR